MCQQHHSEGPAEFPPHARGVQSVSDTQPFPWDAGVFDAHCHPTDTMGSIALVPGMNVRALTVMSTRSQDQDLVSSIAQDLGVKDGDTLFSPQASSNQRIIPSFGWHPWFSHQLYDDSTAAYDGSEASKQAHYDKVLAPTPSSRDPSFSAGLEEPRPLSEFINETRKRLEKHSLALVGEIGLDKAFKLPVNWAPVEQSKRDHGLTPGGREDRRLSPFRISTEHQTIILQAQLRLAGEMNRAVSVHGVQVHGALYNAIADCWKGHEKEVLSRREKRRIAKNAEDFSDMSDEEGDELREATQQKPIKSGPSNSGTHDKKRPYPPRICLHSFSGPVNILKQYTHPSVPAQVYFSFSTAVNWNSSSDKLKDVIRAVPDDRILIESDLHIAGEQMDQALEDVCRKICSIKGWELRDGIGKLAKNWKWFVFGNNP
ncbi:Cut9-interacting protein scn1 [Pseudomassariella vexata]|uniref:Cut9-interacting protein scn1 n=1 Tax=Pseudomassariella vexata TaxID=1141098 RepID=A0A1Y2E0E6_9PEZI|nr:Cut9-interacting protein scn1 [Pseudomassariella vexata]ORY65018.1 Cut9-interacting protein scn1 [Pseudomassariella vexata]